MPSIMTSILKCFSVRLICVIDFQRPQILGVKNEMEIARLVHDNTSLLRFGIFLEVRGARVQVTDSIKRNSDNCKLAEVLYVGSICNNGMNLGNLELLFKGIANIDSF